MEPPTPFNIAVVDDHELVRNAYVSVIDRWPHGQVVLTATDGIDYMEALPSAPPIHLAIVDLSMPRRDGYGTIAWMREHQPGTLAVALSHDPDDLAVRRAMRAGACSVWNKGLRVEELFRRLDQLRRDRFCMTDQMRAQLDPTGRLLPDPEAPTERFARLLTEQEREFTRVYCNLEHPSMANAAAAMHKSVHTVRGYCKDIYTKLEVRSDVEFYRVATQWKLHR